MCEQLQLKQDQLDDAASEAASQAHATNPHKQAASRRARIPRQGSQPQQKTSNPAPETSAASALAAEAAAVAAAATLLAEEALDGGGLDGRQVPKARAGKGTKAKDKTEAAAAGPPRPAPTLEPSPLPAPARPPPSTSPPPLLLAAATASFGVPWARFAALLADPAASLLVAGRRGNQETIDPLDVLAFDAEQLVARGAMLGGGLAGWQGGAMIWTTRQPLTFLPASPAHATVFSDTAHRGEVSQ